MGSALRRGAAGGRGGGGGGGVFVDFDPPFEFIQREDEEVFIVQLKGFKKEQLTVQVKRDRKVAISGERPLSDSRFSRFHKEFPVPAHCNTQAIAAKFDEGVLYLVLPKTPPPLPPPPSPPSTKPQTTPSPAQSSKDRKPPKQPHEEKKTEEEATEKDRHHDRPTKRSEEEEEKRKEESSIEKDYHARLRDTKDGGDGGDRLPKGKWKDGAAVPAADRGSRAELWNLKLKMGNLELELHRTKRLVKGLVVAIAVSLGIGFYLECKLTGSKWQNAKP